MATITFIAALLKYEFYCHFCQSLYTESTTLAWLLNRGSPHCISRPVTTLVNHIHIVWKLHNNLGGRYVTFSTCGPRPQHTVTGVALCHKEAGRPCSKWRTDIEKVPEEYPHQRTNVKAGYRELYHYNLQHLCCLETTLQRHRIKSNGTTEKRQHT